MLAKKWDLFCFDLKKSLICHKFCLSFNLWLIGNRTSLPLLACAKNRHSTIHFHCPCNKLVHVGTTIYQCVRTSLPPTFGTLASTFWSANYQQSWAPASLIKAGCQKRDAVWSILLRLQFAQPRCMCCFYKKWRLLIHQWKKNHWIARSNEAKEMSLELWADWKIELPLLCTGLMGTVLLWETLIIWCCTFKSFWWLKNSKK